MINWLISSLTLILPWGNLLRFELWPNIFIRLIDLAAGALLLVILWENKNHYFKLLFTKNRPLVYFGLILIASNLFSKPYLPTLPGLFYLVRTLGYLMLIPYFFEKQKGNSLPLVNFVRLSLAITVFSGLVQYWFYPELRNLFYLGYDPHAYRLFGFYFDPNILGIILVWGFFFGLRFPHITNRLFLPLIFLALLLTYSRISWIAFFVGLTHYFLTQKKVFWLIAFGLFFGIFVLFLPRHFGEGTNLFRTNSLFGKMASIELTKNELNKTNWVLGIGFNNTNQVKMSPNSALPDNSQYGMDSSFLTVLLTTGLLGVLGYLWIFWSFGKQTDWFRQTLTLTYFIHSLSVNSFFTPGVFIYYLLMISLNKKVPKTTQHN